MLPCHLVNCENVDTESVWFGVEQIVETGGIGVSVCDRTSVDVIDDSSRGECGRAVKRRVLIHTSHQDSFTTGVKGRHNHRKVSDQHIGQRHHHKVVPYLKHSE